jgi:hypothetical protein
MPISISSKTRTKEQEIKGRDLILQKITETTDNTAIAFTDGSCLVSIPIAV